MAQINFRLDPNIVLPNTAEPTSAPDDRNDIDASVDSDTNDQPDPSKTERIELAHIAWRDANGQLSIKKAARIFGISYSTLRGRINGAVSKQQANQAMQRLTVAEEEAIRDWLLSMASWGWPIRVDRLRKMAVELLKDKGDTTDLGTHWTEQFLNRYSEVQSRFVSPLDGRRAEAQDPEIYRHWFQLYKATVEEYKIKPENRYNMDEKGVLMGCIGKVRVIVSKYDKKAFMTEPGSREWVSLIECVSLDGRRTRPWIIFKGKLHQKSWLSLYPDAHIALSDNGWTDHEIGLEWFKICFEPETRCGDEYRLLILDGHSSHITTQVIRFCVASKIIPLCLPPHTTHHLQPLDVGIFAPLASAYKSGVRERSKFIVSYSIDKVDFLEIYRTARDQAITNENIRKAWKTSGLEPLNPEIALAKLPKKPDARPSTPPSTVTLTGPSGESVQVPITPGNVAQVDELFKRIVEGEPGLDPATVLKIQKLCKGASRAIADVSIQRATNVDLITAELTKKKRSSRQRDHQHHTFGRVLNESTLRERESFCQFQDVWKELSRIRPNLLGKPTKKPTSKKAPRKRSATKGKKAPGRLPIHRDSESEGFESEGSESEKPESEESENEPMKDFVPDVRTRSGRKVVRRNFFDP
jgi:hypothetical protein